MVGTLMRGETYQHGSHPVVTNPQQWLQGGSKQEAAAPTPLQKMCVYSLGQE